MAGYGSDDGFDAYADDVGYATPDGADVTAARQRGSAYIDGTFGYRFPGVPTAGIEQDRAWPRTGATDYYGQAIGPAAIPTCVVNASYEAAMLELTTPGSLAVVASGAGRVKSLKAGSAQIEYADGGNSDVVGDNTPVSTTIAGMLFPVIGPATMPGVLVV